jgi:hypothetical protein
VPATLETPPPDSARTDRRWGGRPPSQWLANAARVTLLAGPTALAFFAGGYFDGPRAWAGLGAWVLVAVAVAVCRRSLPTGAGPALALLGLGLMTALTLVSFTWAPAAGDAYHAAQRVMLYAGVLLASAILLAPRAAQRAVEPALAAGAVVVIGYGIAGRLLPGVLHYARSISAQGRLEQPLTYWNAMGELAALGLVLAIRLAGDVTRPRALRCAAAAAAAPLGMGLYLSFSRGALFAIGAGVVALIVLAPDVAQLRAAVLGICAGGLAAAASAPFAGVTSLSGDLAQRERQGAIVLAAVAVISAGAALAARWLVRHERADRLRLPRHAPALATLVICLGLVVAVIAGAKESSGAALSPGASRYTSLQSNRYDYWRVGLREFGQHPLAGGGAGSWASYWLRWRPFNAGAQDAHSLPVQTLAELGVIGLALLAAFLAGIGVAAHVAHRAMPALAAGPVAGVIVYVAHSPLDWDWQMPAVTLVALVLAGALLAMASDVAVRRRGEAAGRRGAPAVRWLLGAGAVLACAWFALGIRASHDIDAVNALLADHSSLTRTQASTAAGRLSDAALLDPDESIDSTRAIVQARAGQPHRAVTTARAVARAHGLDLNAWLVAQYLAGGGVDPAVHRSAVAHTAALVPPVPPAP